MNRPISDRLDAYVEHLVSTCPPALQAWTAATESEFSVAIESAIETAIIEIESGARLCASMDELSLSWFLTKLLTAASVPATAEAYHNGHVDVTIRHPAGRPYFVLGECKIYRGYQHHCEGCRQLLVRYSSGRSTRTFCLEFFRTPEMYEKLRKLRDEFNARRPLDQIDDAVAHTIKGAFLTLHKHFTAARVEVLHLGCNIFHPESTASTSTDADTTL